ncbi:MAG: glycosyltransferase family 2 protein [Bacteroidaceae bacterium]|nr:glycosyltransferase family 2 protein [Bacteroidaceae bacterium]
MTAIILVNWNGADDTIACLRSLQIAEGDFFVVVADNASDDDSLQRISAFIDGNNSYHKVYLLPLDDNYGFAVGNNKAICFASRFAPDSYMLLNNDTEVEPDFLSRLMMFSETRREYRVLTPQINYFDEKNLIWECGGDIKTGRRVVRHANMDSSVLYGVEFMPITSVSGCAFFFYPELLDKDGNLFTDRYFFGEEDFEFSMRMKKMGVRMACVPGSRIYHKVGRSRNKMKAIAYAGKYYMYYLNRLITLRLHMPSFRFKLIKFMYMPNCFRYFYSVNHSFSASWKILLRLYREVDTKYGVSKSDFRALMIDNDYFDKK